MKRVILAPDSFKGTLSASCICRIQEEVIKRHFPQATVYKIPMADGGEGLTEAYLKIFGGQRVEVPVTGPKHETVTGFYSILPDGTAILEMAAAAGLPLMEGKRDPLTATTYGVGELLLHAVQSGAKKILLGLGGSATNDGGIGMAQALGYRFFDKEGKEVEPLAKNLKDIASIVPPEEPFPLTVTAACDVENPLWGKTGATTVFGPQKGVTDKTFSLLEEGLKNLAALMEKDTGKDIAGQKGAGAAGGLGAGVLYFLQGTLKPGIEMLLDAAGFDELLKEADLVITGEGRMDYQSAFGKVPAGVGLRCKRAGVPCIALCGSLGQGSETLYDYGITAMFSTLRQFTDFETVKKTCEEDMRQLTESLMRVLAMGK